MTSLWQGPEDKGPQGGVTFSLLSRFICCRERFRVHALEGLRTRPRFQHRTEYGSMFHLAEEVYATGGDWRVAVFDYSEKLCRTYPFDQDEIDKWYNVVLTQFPLYLDYWRDPGLEPVTPVLREEVFDVPYKLPSGRVVRFRGRYDGADLVGLGTGAVGYLGEKKTKGDVDQAKISRQLTWDLQTMIYLITLPDHLKKTRPEFRHRIQGVRYDVVRRPLSGGKGTIVQKKGSKNVPAETKQEYYTRLGQYIKDEPESYFFRWSVDVAPGDVERFRERTLDPLLENLCWWYESRTDESMVGALVPTSALHWQHPFGVFNPLDDDGATDLDSYLLNGDTTGLVKVTDLFPELNDEE